MRVLSIQSHVVYGYVGNKAATFPLQLLGMEVDPLNTVNLSNHTKYPACTGNRLDKQEIVDLGRGLIENGFMREYTHVLAGYLGNYETVEAVIQIITEIKKIHSIQVFIDPVMGDDGKLYVSRQLVEKYPALVKIADVITPNGFEAEVLSGIKVSSDTILNVFDKLHSMGPRTVVITSVLENGTCYLYASIARNTYTQQVSGCFQFKIEIQLIPQQFTGTGDLFSALLLANCQKFPFAKACERSVDSVHAVLQKTIEFRTRGCELAIVQSASVVVDPPRSCQAMNLDGSALIDVIDRL